MKCRSMPVDCGNFLFYHKCFFFYKVAVFGKWKDMFRCVLRIAVFSGLVVTLCISFLLQCLEDIKFYRIVICKSNWSGLRSQCSWMFSSRAINWDTVTDLVNTCNLFKSICVVCYFFSTEKPITKCWGVIMNILEAVISYVKWM